MTSEPRNQERQGVGAVPLFLAILLVLLLSLAGYSAAYLSLSTVSDATVPAENVPYRFRYFNQSWQIYFFLPASAVETVLVQRRVTLACDDTMIWHSYPELRP